MTSTLPSVDLTGKVALVTGGGRGLGRHMAQKLAASGAAIAITGRTVESLEENIEAIRAAGGSAIGIAADVTDRAAVERMVQEVENQLGAVDVLVNNAGVLEEPGPIHETDPDVWWHVMDVNVRGPFLCARTVLPAMIRRKQGVIINVASAAGIGTIPYGSSYCASKAALIRFTDCLHTEVRQHHIAVFSLDPGTVRTDMAQYLIDSDEGKKYVSWFAGIFTGGRDVPPEMSADLVAFLASGQANSLSGRYISVEHNLPEMLQHVEEILQNDLYAMRLRT